jgi:hypothetical protein
MGSCQSTHYDLYIVNVNGADIAVHRSRYEAELYTTLHTRALPLTIRHLIVDRQSGIVLGQTQL